MKAISYKLAEYKIIEDDNGALWWESHAGLGGLQGGKCFIRGDILFIGPPQSEKPGFLKREFLDRLGNLPGWEKTRYYCLSFSIHVSKSGRKLTREEIDGWSGNRPATRETARHAGARRGIQGRPEEFHPKEASFRLGRYEILEKANGEVWWKTYSDRGTLRVGKCFKAEEILFIGAGTTEESGDSKDRFLARISRLPGWNSTKYFCPQYGLYDCRTGKNLVTGGSRPGRAVKRREPEFPAKGKSARRPKVLKLNPVRWGPIALGPGIKRWVGYIAASLLILGALLSVAFVGHWYIEERHHEKDHHSSGHHRDH